MANMCKVQIIGNVGRDPEQRYSQSGTMSVSFSVAVNDRKRNQDGSFQEQTEWFRVTTFGRLAEICQQYVVKGRTVYVDGRLRLDRWTGQDGQPRTTLDVTANDVVLMDPRPRGDEYDGGTDAEARRPDGEARRPAAAPSRGGQAPGPAPEPSDLEDLPF
jgi:single-strand DNA-binding protein